jgi:hypothetical protein
LKGLKLTEQNKKIKLVRFNNSSYEISVAVDHLKLLTEVIIINDEDNDGDDDDDDDDDDEGDDDDGDDDLEGLDGRWAV